MSNNPLVSVIIPVYNVEKYLKQCIDSVLSQTYLNYEVILIDDGSEDSSSRICDEYADRFSSCISVIHKRNSGLSEARNTGLSLAVGEYVVFIDSDDWISADNFEKMLSIALVDNSDFVFSDALCFEDSSKEYQIKQHYIRTKLYSTDKGINVFSELQEENDFHCAVQMYLWKRSFLVDNHLSFYSGILYEDMLFTYNAFLLANRVSHCHENIYHRRFRDGSIVTSKPTYKNFLSAQTVYFEVSNLTDSNNNKYTQMYCSRCAFKALDLFQVLPFIVRKNHYREFILLKNKIKKNNYHNDVSLKMMVRGRGVWFVYKVFSKSLNTIRKGS